MNCSLCCTLCQVLRKSVEELLLGATDQRRFVALNQLDIGDLHLLVVRMCEELRVLVLQIVQVLSEE